MRTTKGKIYKSGKQGAYYIRYTVNGHEFRTALRDENGNPIYRETKAREAADELLKPIIAKNTAKRLASLRDAAETAERKAQILEQKAKEKEIQRQNQKAEIKNAWSLFLSCLEKYLPKSCLPQTLKNNSQSKNLTTADNYQSYVKRLDSWIRQSKYRITSLSEITPEIASDFINHIREQFSSNTVNKNKTFMKMLFNVLMQDKKITIEENPFDMPLDEKSSRSRKELTREQVSMLLNNAEPDMRLLLAIGYFSGFRFSNCCTLKWEEIDLDRKIIERLPDKIRSRVKDKLEATVKLGIPPVLYNLLKKQFDESDKSNPYVLPIYAHLYLKSGGEQANRRVIRYFEECGIETKYAGTGIPAVRNAKGKVIKPAVRALTQYGFHSLRYSYISHNAEAGVPASVIQKNAGHSSPAMTEHYTRISDASANEYANQLRLTSLDFYDDQTVHLHKETESERDMLKRLAETLPIAEIQKMLAVCSSK